jgi:two-component system cell cycle response regulator
MDGFEIKSRLNSERGTASIPVIFLTSRSDLHSKLEGYKLGIDDYVVKPFNSEELVARMRAVLKRREFYEEISMTDALTGLYNRHYFQNELRTFFVIAKRYRQMFSLAVIDIDGLKTINDTYGHGAGDHLLISFAETAKKVMRESDILIRQGGDEFAMIFPDVDAANASLAMKRLTDAIGRKKLVYKDHGVALPFSMSTGIVEFSAKFKDENEMFKLADSLMYEDKKSKKK